MNEAHLTEEEVQRLAGPEVEGGESDHVAECEICRRRVEAARAVDRSLRRMELAQTSPGFTASVMHELGLAPGKRSGLWFVESLAAFSALTLVLGTLVAVFFLAGGEGGSEPALRPAEEGWNRVADDLGSLSGAIQEWLTKSVPAFSGSSGVELALLMCAAVVALGVADRYIVRSLRHPARR